MNRDTHCNIIGPVVRRLRKRRGWSQATLADRLQIAGWNISRSGVAKIECRVVWVGDFELLYFIRIFGVEIGELFPRHNRQEPVRALVQKCPPDAGAESPAVPR